MSFDIEFMVTQPDCSILIQNPSPSKKLGNDIGSKRSNGHGVAAMLFAQIMQQAGRLKNAYFQHVQTSPNST